MRNWGKKLVIAMGFVGLPAAGDQLPPLGKRVYLLDEHKPARPTDIRALERGSSVPGQNLMRDPLPLAASTTLDKSSHKPAEGPKRLSRMVFDKVNVQGRYLVPRVTFDRSTMDVGRSEEPVKVEYRKKILESERELKEFDW